MHHGAGERVVVAEVAVGGGNVTLSQRLANARTAHAHGVHVLARDFFHAQAVAVGILAQVVEAALAVFAKAVVVANHQLPGPHGFQQQVLDVVFRSPLRKLAGEGHDEQVVNAQFGQLGNPLVEGVNQLQLQ